MNLIPDNDRFISAAAGVLDRGYVLTMDAGDTASRMFSKGENISTYGMEQEHPYALGYTGDIDICADPIYTMVAYAGSRAGLDNTFFGPKLSLENGTPVKITTGEYDARLRENFTATSFLMNLFRRFFAMNSEILLLD
jgi:hypothetical protein